MNAILKLIISFSFLMVMNSNSFSQNVNDTLPLPPQAPLMIVEQMPTFI